MKFPSGTMNDVLQLIADNPLAWLVTNSSSGFDATPLPLLPETNADGELIALIGHCSRFNAQVTDLQADNRALILFSGPNGYISPSLVSQKHWVPTWNFAVAMISVEVEFQSEHTLIAVDQLVQNMEADQSPGWSLADAGDRLEPLMSRIIGFRAHVRDIDARFKLGQDESIRSIAEIIDGVRNPSLKSWMQQFNSDRIQADASEEEARTS